MRATPADEVAPCSPRVDCSRMQRSAPGSGAQSMPRRTAPSAGNHGTTPYSDQRCLGELSVRGVARVSYAVVAPGGVRECLVGGGTIQSHSPAVNREPDTARMCRRELAWFSGTARRVSRLD